MELGFSLEIDNKYTLVVSSQAQQIDFKVEERKNINTEYYQVTYDKDKDIFAENYKIDSNDILKSFEKLIDNKALQYRIDSSNMVLQLNDLIKITLEKKKYEKDDIIKMLVNKVNELYIDNEKKNTSNRGINKRGKGSQN